MTEYDAVVIGSGPNGLAAAITMARAGCSVLVIEAKDAFGGGMRSAELTLPGYVHDVCSAAHPMGISSPFFRDVPLDQFGLEWIMPSAPVAHPLDNQPSVVMEQSIEATLESLDTVDRKAYRWLFQMAVNHYEDILDQFLGPLMIPKKPLLIAQFGVRAIVPTTLLMKTIFRGERARALFSGIAAHSILPLEWTPSAGVGMVLGMLAHAVNYPLAKGGSQKIADAMVGYLRSLGGELRLNWHIKSFDELPSAKAYFFDTAPRGFIEIMGESLPAGYANELRRFRYAPGVFKVDYALDAPIPWRDPNTARASTIHVGGTLDELAHSERAVWRGEHVERPYILLIQPTAHDPSRAPEGKHVVWAYCHVPNGSTVDMTAAIDAQIERFAPGFQERVLAKSTRNTAQVEEYNPNYVGGDVNAGAQTLMQLFTRPAFRLLPYITPVKGVYLCSSSTPPGGGVHGMCGWHAAKIALERM